eukprot:3008853-Rhodomonas_salina.5
MSCDVCKLRTKACGFAERTKTCGSAERKHGAGLECLGKCAGSRELLLEDLGDALAPLEGQRLVHDEEVLVALQLQLRVAREDFAPRRQVRLLRAKPRRV